MNICVCGWYFREPFLSILKEVNKDFPVHIVANKMADILDDCGLDYSVRENTGLEFGAYDYYLKNIWDGEDTLFLHDDITINPIAKNYEVLPPKYLFKDVSKLKGDLVYIFKNAHDKRKCFDVHGRVMFASGNFLTKLKQLGGFPYDEKNDGFIFGPKPEHCKHFNWAVTKLKEIGESLMFDYSITQKFMPAFNYDVRGGATTY